ncbi:MAG TPA: ABC transporter permease [Chitinophagales bacterium]|nr:ABC transporter permease [Chitinophagales bacterium]
MGKIWIIIQREYITRVKRRAFIITTLLAPLGFFVLIASSVLIGTISQSRTDVAIVDQTGLFKDIAIPDADDHTVYFHKVDDNYDALLNQIPKDKNDHSKFQAVILIPANFDVNNPNRPGIAYRYVQRPGLMKRQFINERISDAVRKLRMKMLKISDEEVEQMGQKTEVNFDPLYDRQEQQGYAEAASIAGMIMGFAIYISLFFYGTMIMKGVMEEKTNRIVEVLTSSVKPFQMLMGKIIGIGGVGLTQFILWILLSAGVNFIAGIIFGISIGHSHTTMTQVQPGNGIDSDDIQLLIQNLGSLPFTQIIILFPLYFLGGFLLYGSLFAAVGAAMGEDGDQQSLMLPVTVPIIISIFIAINVINNPDSNLGFWGSVIPFTSPVVMSALLPFRPVWWQIGLSLVLLAAGFVFTTWVAARIYRVGILMYGKKVSFKQMGRWIFSKA